MRLSWLCGDCEDIFSKPRELSYGTYYPWKSANPTRVSRSEQCHLCAILEKAKSSPGFTDKSRRGSRGPPLQPPTPFRYAFKVFNDDWAQYGEGPQWPTVEFSGDYDDEVAVGLATMRSTRDPTDCELSRLLATDSADVTDGSLEFWLVLVFSAFSRESMIVLPLELQTDDEPETIAQIDLENQSSTGTPENMRLAKYWLRNCHENHPRCRLSAHAEPSGWLPTRLLYVGSETSPCLRLVCTGQSSWSDQAPYAALSYRWGGQKQFVLTRANLEDHCDSIPIFKLSKTIQETIQACRGIGLEYLWVDACCILQDDEEDWARESVTMSKVYGLAACTIAAANSGDPDDGCFARRNQYHVRPCLIPNPFNPAGSKLKFYARSQFMKDIFEQEVRQSAWYNRGWVFQERILSSRLLIFGKTQMLWSCQEIQAAETWPSGKTSENFIDQFDSFEVDKTRFQKLLDPSRYVSDFDDLWAVFLRDYTSSGRNFTKMSDRLVALQGLASQIENSTGHRYCAGLWLDRSLPASLLWTGCSSSRPNELKAAPSWSWASVDGPIEFNRGRFKGTAAMHLDGIPDLARYQANPLENRRLELRVSGRLLRVTVLSDESQLPCGLVAHGTTSHQSLISQEEEKPKRKTPKRVRVATRIKNRTQRLVQTARAFTNKAGSGLSDAGFEAWLVVRYGPLRCIRKIPWRPLRLALGIPIQMIWKCLDRLVWLLTSPLWVLRLLLSTWQEDKAAAESRLAHANHAMVPSIDVAMDPNLKASCFYDFPKLLDAPTFIFPVLTGYRTSGLIVQPAPGLTGVYERIGVFEMDGLNLKKFTVGSDPLVDQIFGLI